jgi:3',5'-cyclic AMP phosphodiesterase CpdA
VPEGGHLETSQTDWLAQELAAADATKPLVVALHHPPYSVDQHHGGSARMGAALDAAFKTASRAPELVLTGHVHDYQRFTRQAFGKQITYVVIGNGGYSNLHALAADAKPGYQLAPDVTFEFGDDKNWGFLSFTAGAGKLSATYTAVAKDGTVTAGRDSWSVSV